MRIMYWSSDVCSSDLITVELSAPEHPVERQSDIGKGQQRDRPGDRALRRARSHRRVQRRGNPGEVNEAGQQGKRQPQLVGKPLAHRPVASLRRPAVLVHGGIRPRNGNAPIGSAPGRERWWWWGERTGG